MMLPPEILLTIFQHLDLASLVSLSQVSRHWKSALNDDFFFQIASRDFHLENRRFPIRQSWSESAHVIYRRAVNLVSHVTESKASKYHVTQPHDHVMDELAQEMSFLNCHMTLNHVKPVAKHVTSRTTLNCPLSRDFTILFPTYSLQHLNNGYQQFDDGYCTNQGYVRLSRDLQYCLRNQNHLTKRDTYTCSNGLVIDMPQNYKITGSTPTVKSRDAEGIWHERVDFERVSRDLSSHVIVATSSSASAVWECVSGTLRVFWLSNESRDMDTKVYSSSISRDWTRNKVQLFVYKQVVLIAVTQIHYIDWSIHSKQVWDVYQVTYDHVGDDFEVHVTQIQSRDSSWGNILWYDGLRLCNTPQFACDRTHVISDTIEASQWGYGNVIRFNFDRDWVVGYDCNHVVKWLKNTVTGEVEVIPEHKMSFVGVSRGRLKVCVFDWAYLEGWVDKS